MTEHGLGRLVAPDERDTEYPILTLLGTAEPEPTRRWRYWWQSGWWGDQGATSQCVGYAWAHWVEDGPIGHGGLAPILLPETIYNAARLVDEWPGEEYEGTSVRAGAKAVETAGLIESYHWGYDVDTVVAALADLGPVVMGTDWYDGMFEPDGEGIIRATGSVAGGHAYVLNGVNRPRARVRVKNSWGRAWGHNGQAWLPFEELEKLLANDGEACIAIEKREPMVGIQAPADGSLSEPIER